MLAGTGVRSSPNSAETEAQPGRAVRALIVTLLLLAGARGQSSDTPLGFEQIESAFLGFMTANALPGASLAIAKNGKLVFARGYGMADVELNQPVQPESTFRFGSIGKTITAMAIMKLVQAGKLDLDASAFALIPDIRPRSGRLGDSRINRITIRNLLTHSGGWDASKSGDPIVAPFSQQIASAVGVAFPPPPSAVISYMLDRPLDFDPGTQFAYCNFGFLVLGRVIEKISGLPYSEFVRLQVLTPLGIERMRQGRTPLSLRAPGEVRYYDYPGAPLVDSLMQGVSGKVTEPYSGIVALESIDSAGGWIASAIDLARIFTMLDGWGAPALLSPEAVQQMVTPVFPTDASSPAGPVFQGLGIGVSSTGPDALWAHGGGAFGTASFACRPRHGWAWAVIFNGAPRDYLYTTAGAPNFLDVLQRVISVDALESVVWPDVDLFTQYLPSGRPTIAPDGVIHSASGQPAVIAPGELITLYGTYFGVPDGGTSPLSIGGIAPVESSGTSVWVNGTAAPLLFRSPRQLNAVVPFATKTSGSAELKVQAFGYTSEPILLPAAAASPALFTTDGSGKGPVAALNQDGTLNSPANPASVGDVVTVYGTGFGVTTPISQDGVTADVNLLNIASPVSVTVAGKTAQVSYAGSAPGLISGVSQVNFQVPDGVSPGAVAVIVSAGVFASPSGATIAVK
jgi:N-acyl-D-amino-acid deacylase